MNFPSNDSLIYRHRLSLNPKSKNQIVIPAFSNLPEPQAGGLNRNKRSSIGLPQGRSIRMTTSSRTVAPSSRNLGSTKDIQNTISYLTFKDILKNNNQKSNKKLASYEIRIRVFSNYGHESLITSSEIDVLDQNQATIRNVTCSVSSFVEDKDENNINNPINHPENENMYDNKIIEEEEDTSYRLVNQNIIKNTVEEVWTHSWNSCLGTNEKSNKNGVDIKLMIKSEVKPHYVRIFPSPFLIEANLKDIKIFVKDKFLYEGTLNQTFCSVIELQYDGGCATDIQTYIKSEDKNKPHLLRDSFGILPFCLTSEISISVIESYNKKPNISNSLNDDETANDPSKNSITIGIRKIAFFLTNGELVKQEMMALSSKNIKCFQPLTQLFTDEITAASDQPWKGSYMDDNEFLINFSNPLPIAAIGILSPSYHTTSSDIRVKKLAVKVNRVMRFVGKIVNQNPNYEERNSDDNFTFFIFLTNHKDTKEKIPKYFK